MTYRRALSRRRYLTARHFYSRVDLECIGEAAGDNGAESQVQDEVIDRLAGQNLLQTVFEELSHDQRQTLRLFFFEGYTLSEIAALLGQSVGNVSHHYYRGLESLRRRIFGGKLQSK
jgi:RNA polymerase sigma-70 factor (ECF subfamily)